MSPTPQLPDGNDYLRRSGISSTYCTTQLGSAALPRRSTHNIGSAWMAITFLADLRDRFDEVLTACEAASGWQTERPQRPVLILGQLDGILTGVRQLRRTVPLQTEVLAGLRVPTLAEMARIKAWLLVTRNTVRDYLDTVVLFERLGDEGVRDALRSFDEIYRQPNGASPLAELGERLAAATPQDHANIDLKDYRGLRPPWNDWERLVDSGRSWAAIVASLVMGMEE